MKECILSCALLLPPSSFILAEGTGVEPASDYARWFSGPLPYQLGYPSKTDFRFQIPNNFKSEIHNNPDSKRFQISKISNLRSQISDHFRFQISNFKFQISIKFMLKNQMK